VTNTADPLGGSYFVEALTDRMEAQARRYFRRIDELGGMVEAVRTGFPQREIADASYVLQHEIDTGRRPVVGVNCHRDESEVPMEILRIDAALEQKQLDRLATVRARRDDAAVEASLEALKLAADADENLMPLLIDAARASATEGEIVGALQGVFGKYQETPVF
jgi:methylmalonyl-CoA mutase N-terminal domain/subunit